MKHQLIIKFRHDLLNVLNQWEGNTLELLFRSYLLHELYLPQITFLKRNIADRIDENNELFKVS